MAVIGYVLYCGIVNELTRYTWLASGLVVVEDAWAGLFDIVTGASTRRRGYGQRMVQSLLHAAWQMGARNAYLQVNTDNTAARALYAHYGFRQRYEYWYRGRPASESTA